MYQEAIKKAELAWLKGNYKEAIHYFKEALRFKQKGHSVTKIRVMENIKELENEKEQKNKI